MIFALAGAALLMGVALGLWTARAGRWGVLWAILAAALAFGAWVFWSVQARPNRSGFDGVAEVALTVLGVGPFVIGAALAAVLTWMRQ